MATHTILNKNKRNYTPKHEFYTTACKDSAVEWIYIFLIIFAGTPTAVTRAGTLFITTPPAPITE